ncbi:hypothetical protein PRIPAC_83298 [Pristionchus pacificus]|uniref:Uncharacterized protein n=1 Tax=Pristionchus pacificus TaxID=54126 RepID=A0A2A6BNV0_PRIPA|nr:hypothetical protein PRIPAC_83298 [Pristionchus pacificus]|eukprot:PDM67587.1 hypothetical protein PRIPAC_49004 [Pristionchus pacificus]
MQKYGNLIGVPSRVGHVVRHDEDLEERDAEGVDVRPPFAALLASFGLFRVGQRVLLKGKREKQIEHNVRKRIRLSKFHELPYLECLVVARRAQILAVLALVHHVLQRRSSNVWYRIRAPYPRRDTVPGYGGVWYRTDYRIVEPFGRPCGPCHGLDHSGHVPIGGPGPGPGRGRGPGRTAGPIASPAPVTIDKNVSRAGDPRAAAAARAILLSVNCAALALPEPERLLTSADLQEGGRIMSTGSNSSSGSRRIKDCLEPLHSFLRL